jgi:ATP-dependent helicase HrpA
VRRLFAIAERRELKSQVQWLPQIEKMRMLAAPLCKKRPLEEQLIDLLADRALFGNRRATQLPRTADDFDVLRRLAAREIVPSVQQLSKIALPLFEAYHAVRLALEQARPPTWQYAVDDLRDQLAHLVFDNFLAAVPWDWLQHYPRYLKAMALRLQKITSSGLPRDSQHHDQVARHWRQYQGRAESHRKQGRVDPELTTYRWLIEELRVSLFAQELGTSQPISPQRLDKQWAKVT